MDHNNSSHHETPKLRVGIAGLGVASSQVLPAFKTSSAFYLAAGADIRIEARQAFEAAYDRPTVATVAELAARDDLDAIWISTPNTRHEEHAVCAAQNGKHVICEKPIAVTLDQCDRMIEAADANGVHFLQGHSKIYQAPIKKMREIINSKRLGRVLQIHSVNYNDWLQRPRLAAELDTTQGGGIVYRQGPHIIDIVRFLGGGLVRNVRGTAGKGDQNFDAYGHFNALLEFDNGVTASVAFNGYGYFDVTELTWGIGESGFPQTQARRFPGRRPRIKGPADPDVKSAVAQARGEEGKRDAAARRQPFFGLTIVLLEHGVLRQSPDGLYVYTEAGCEEVACASSGAREAELTELAEAISEGRQVFPDGRWGKATLEVCLAIMRSGQTGDMIELSSQVPSP